MKTLNLIKSNSGFVNINVLGILIASALMAGMMQAFGEFLLSAQQNVAQQVQNMDNETKVLMLQDKFLTQCPIIGLPTLKNGSVNLSSALLSQLGIQDVANQGGQFDRTDPNPLLGSIVLNNKLTPTSAIKQYKTQITFVTDSADIITACAAANTETASSLTNSPVVSAAPTNAATDFLSAYVCTAMSSTLMPLCMTNYAYNASTNTNIISYINSTVTGTTTTIGGGLPAAGTKAGVPGGGGAHSGGSGGGGKSGKKTGT